MVRKTRSGLRSRESIGAYMRGVGYDRGHLHGRLGSVVFRVYIPVQIRRTRTDDQIRTDPVNAIIT
jgi:hypothetical protein